MAIKESTKGSLLQKEKLHKIAREYEKQDRIKIAAFSKLYHPFSM
jgi:hypothetical protein